MITNLSPEDKRAWDRQMSRYSRHQKYRNRLEKIKEMAPVILLIAVAIACAVMLFSCGRIRNLPPQVIKIDDVLDTPVIIDHGDYLEVRFKHGASFTSKPGLGDSTYTMISGSMYDTSSASSLFGPPYDTACQCLVTKVSYMPLPKWVDTSGGIILNAHDHMDGEGDCLYDSLGRLIRVEKGKCDLIEMVWEKGKWVPWSESSRWKTKK